MPLKDAAMVRLLLPTLSAKMKPQPLIVLLLLSPMLLCCCEQGVIEPHLSLDVNSAVVWKCHRPESATLQRIQQGSHELLVELLSVGSQWVELAATPTHQAELASFGLSGCEQVADLAELFAAELVEHWATLNHANRALQYSLENHAHNSLEGHTHHSHVGHTNQSVEDHDYQSHEGHTHKGIDGHTRQRLRRGLAPADRSDEEQDWFSSYHNFSVTYSWYHRLAEQYPSNVFLNASIGQTYYGRDIIALHISDFRVSRRKLKIYLQCLLHPREWITGPVCMYITQHLASMGESDKMLANLLKEVEFIVVPVANPDGYYLTWLQYPKYRLWRKNGSPQNGTQCAGVDLNRNFDSHWNEKDSSSDPCSNLYSGKYASSELETQAIAAYIQTNGPMIGAIDFHSYYQEILYPPAWSSVSVPGTDTLNYVAKWVAAAANQIGKQYTARSMNSVYLASGTFADWLLDHGHYGSEYEWSCCIPLTVELRPEPHPANPYSGFMLPTSEILPTCQEMVPAVLKFAALVLDKRRNCYAHDYDAH